jgi:hypothetical protein
VYGSDAAAGKANTTGNANRGAALCKGSSGIAQYGTFSGNTWNGTNIIGNGTYRETTIKVVNGVLQ